MRQRLLKGNIAILVVFSMIFSSLFGLMPYKVHAATISDANGEHCFGNYFTYSGGTGTSTDNFYKVTSSKYIFGSDDSTCAWLMSDTPDKDSVYITVTNSGVLGSFELVSVDLGEFNDAPFSNVYIEGYSNGEKIFTTTPYYDGQTQYLPHYSLDCSSALGKYIDSFSIFYTKDAGTGFGHGDFSFYSFTTRNAIRDNIPPYSPIISGITDDTGTSTSDGITIDNTPTFSGTAEANSTVSLYNGSTLVATTYANGSGEWNYTLTTALAEGTYNFTATATDIADNVSPPSAIKAITIDKTAPSQPATPILDVASDTGVSISDGITNDNTLTIKGTSEPNSTVSIYNGSTLVTTAPADNSGAWSITTSTLSDGTYSFTITATDKAGNVSTISSALSVTIDTAKPAKPSVTSITTDTGTSSSDGITSDTTLCFNGTADADVKVEVFIDGVLVGSTTTDTTGNWSYDHTSVQLTNGSHTVAATATDTAGNVSDTSSPFTFNIDSASPTITSITPPADGTYTYGQTLTFTVTFSETVAVSGGTPSIGITLDGKTVAAQYESGSGTSELTFRYTVGKGDIATASGISLASTINLIGSAIKDTAGNNASLTINNAPSTENIKVDSTPVVTLSASNISMAENGGTIDIVATLSNPASKAAKIQLDYSGTATNGNDYNATTEINIPSGSTTAQIEISSIDDKIYEGNENITVRIASVTNAYGSGAQTLTINDDEGKPTVTLTSAALSFSENGGTCDVTAKLSNKSAYPVTVTLAFSGIAKVDRDYTTSAAIITVPARSTSASITLTGINNSIDEDDKTLIVDITGVTDGTEDGSQSIALSVTDDDAAPSFSVGNTSVAEGDSGTVALKYTVTLSSSSGKVVTIDYATDDGTATAGIASPALGDYRSTSGTLNFAPGDTSKEVTVLVNGEYTREPNETILLKLSNGSNTSNTTAQAIGTILNDDDPELILGGTSFISEGTGAIKGFSFTVTLTKPSSNNISVDFTTEDVTAKAGKDYVATGGSIIFAPGETSKTIDVQIIGDSIDENDETFRVTISNPSPSEISIINSHATCTITDDDTAPIVSIDNTTVTEGNSGTTSAVFYVALSEVSEKNITVNYKTVDGTATWDVTSPALSDYKTTSGTLTFAPGVTLQAIVVDIEGDMVDEYDETLGLELSTPANATISTTNGIGIATITDDDAAPSFSVGDISVAEGDSGTVALKYTITLSSSSGKEVTIDYASEEGTAIGDVTAPASSDFKTTSGTLNFAPGDTSKEVTVLVNGDNTSEPNETVLLKLSNANYTSNTTAQAIGTILNDDGPTISIIGNSVAIMNGDITPSSIDNTDFGSVSVNGSTQTRIFTISNTGFDTLTLTGSAPYITLSGEGATDFSVSTSPASINIANGESVTFAITFNPSSLGTKNANITIESNDIFSSPYTFSIKGTGYYQNDSSQVSLMPDANIFVNGQSQSIAHTETIIENGRSVTTITIDDKKMEEQLEKAGQNAIVQIPIANSPDVSIGVLNAQIIKNMQAREAVLEIKTDNITYTLPASQINIDSIASLIGSSVELRDISVNVSVSASPDNTGSAVQNIANQNGYRIVVKPIDFDISCSSGGKTVEISKFNGYVERTIAIPNGVDPSMITTGVVLNNNATFSHVPTQVFSINGQYYAKINSLTNSTYSLIYNDVKFKDVEGHWAKNSVNEIGSRLIDSGVGEGNFAPDRAITRAEFASMIAKALGLKATKFDSIFTDVDKDSQYYQYIYAAYEYGITDGCGKGKFAPNAQITRQDAMTMIARAMKLTKLDTSISNEDIVKQLKAFSDTAGISSYAKQGVALCIKNGIFSGNNAKLMPKDNYTRAESAVVVLRLLKKANLI